jgi:hypothetical protein
VELVLDAPGREPRRHVEHGRQASKRDVAFTSVTDAGGVELRAEFAVAWTSFAITQITHIAAGSATVDITSTFTLRSVP